MPYAGAGADNEIREIKASENCRFGEYELPYTNNGYAANIPDRVSAGDESELILTCQEDRGRSVYFDAGDYRTYGQTVSLVGMNNRDDFDRTEFFSDIITQLAGVGGSFSGRVVGNMSGEPIADARVEINQPSRFATTDMNGYFSFEWVGVNQFSININRWGYTNIDAMEFTFGENQNALDEEIRMRHPNLDLSNNQVHESVMFGLDQEIALTVRNSGDGPLSFLTRLRGAQIAGALWGGLDSYPAAEMLNDTRLRAVTFVNDHYWIAGGNNRSDDPNLLYKLNRDAELVVTYQQHSSSNYGWRDLTTDGEYLYGVDSCYIAQVNLETGELTDQRIPTPNNPTSGVAWDEVGQVFWVCGHSSDIVAIDRDGEEISRIRNANPRKHIYGLGFFPDDADGAPLYVMTNEQDADAKLMKVNPETSEFFHVTNLELGDSEEGSGCAITNGLHEFTWTLLTIGEGTVDHVRTFEAASDFFWATLSQTSGENIEPEATVEMTLTLNSDGLAQDGEYHTFIQIEHNTPVEGAFWIEVSLNVTVNSVDDGTEIPFDFSISSVYPNPFNSTATVSFTIDQSSAVNLSVFDLTGRQVTQLHAGQLASGSYRVPVNGAKWATGIYLVRLSDGNRVVNQKLTLLK